MYSALLSFLRILIFQIRCLNLATRVFTSNSFQALCFALFCMKSSLVLQWAHPALLAAQRQALRNALNIPLIANGDFLSPKDALVFQVGPVLAERI